MVSKFDTDLVESDSPVTKIEPTKVEDHDVSTFNLEGEE